jgi:hypothetical protein
LIDPKIIPPVSQRDSTAGIHHQRSRAARPGPRTGRPLRRPDAGELLPGDSSGPRLRQYVDDVERVRLVYWVTALKTVVVVAFIEV